MSNRKQPVQSSMQERGEPADHNLHNPLTSYTL